MKGAPAVLNGSSPWAARYAQEVRRIVVEHAEHAPRSQQVHLGPSELGVECDRQVVSKLLGLPKTNHVVDPWPSIVGTATHAWLAEAFDAWNRRHQATRFVTETRVVPHPDHSGTGDLYDAFEQAVVDHKVLGESSMAKIRSADGPPMRYRAQLHLYARGFKALGLPVKRVVLVAYPRTASSLDGLYVWEEEHDEKAEALVDAVLTRTQTRKDMAELVKRGLLTIEQVPTAPDADECFFCDFYRPEAARDGGPGCPGSRAKSETAIVIN